MSAHADIQDGGADNLVLGSRLSALTGSGCRLISAVMVYCTTPGGAGCP
jgi:hypothetical protein